MMRSETDSEQETKTSEGLAYFDSLPASKR